MNRFKHPAHGPYWITEDLIAGLLAHYGWVTTVYKEVSKLADVPDLAILMVDYDPDKESAATCYSTERRRATRQRPPLPT